MRGINEKPTLLKRMAVDMYLNLSLKNIDNILKTVNMVKSKRSGKARVNAGKMVVFEITYPNKDDDIYDTVVFSYYNKATGYFVSSNEYLMDDLYKVIRCAYAKSAENISKEG